MGKNRVFSLYDIEEFLKEAGAEKINERAVVTLERELENTVMELLGQAQVYANYAGRTRLIKGSDIMLAAETSGSRRVQALHTLKAKKKNASRRNMQRVVTEARTLLEQTQEQQTVRL